MKFILSCILSLFVSITFGQGPLFQLLFENNPADSSGNNVIGEMQGTVTYSTTAYQGTYSFYPGGQWESTDSIEVTPSFTYSGWHRITTTTSQAALIASIAASAGVGWYIRIQGTNNDFVVYTKSGSAVDYAYSATNVFTDNAWFHLVVVFDSAVVRFYVNGEKVGYNSAYTYDSTMTPTLTTKLPISVHGYRDGAQTLSNNIRFDNIQLYNYTLNQSQIDSLYNNGTTSFKLSSGEEGEEEAPTIEGYTPKEPLRTTVEKKFLRNSVWKIPYKMEYVEETDPEEGLIVYFADNFEDWALQNPIPYDTVARRWQAEMKNYYSTNQPNQSIVSLSEHGNVWRSQYLEGQCGINYGFAVEALLDQKLDEMYIETDVYFSSSWADEQEYGHVAGKWPGGGISSGYSGSDIIDSTANWETAKGFAAHNTWGSEYLSANRLQTYIYDQTVSMSANTIGNYTVNKGSWGRYTKRVKLNSRGNSDGLVETFINGTLVQQLTGLKFRSIAQYDAGMNSIESITLKYAFGGGIDYCSERDNVVWFDNVTAYAYGASSPEYRSGASESNRLIPRVAGTVSNVMPDRIYIDRNFTAASGTITGVTAGPGFRKVPWARSSSDYRTFTISGHSNPIRIQFTRWADGYNESGNSEMYVKIYSGTGTTKDLKYTFDEATENGVPTIGSTYTISNTSATIIYYCGKDHSFSPELIYW